MGQVSLELQERNLLVFSLVVTLQCLHPASPRLPESLPEPEAAWSGSQEAARFLALSLRRAAELAEPHVCPKQHEGMRCYRKF